MTEHTHPDPATRALIERHRREAASEALRAAADALYRGEGPDLVQDADVVYGEWLGNRADALDADA